MSAEGAANAIPFANTALKPGEIACDDKRCNAIYIPFKVYIPNNEGKLTPMMISVAVALDNAFDPVVNPYGTIVIDYGPLYVDIFRGQKIIKPVPEDDA